MWEWSNKLLKQQQNTSLVSAYKDLIVQNKSAKPDDAKKTSTINSQKIKKLLEEKTSEFGLKDITLLEKPYNPQNWREMIDSFKEYNRIRIAFLKMIAYSNKKELQEIGLTKDDIKLMQMGITPENYNTHIKIPFDFGGTVDFSNICFIKSHPSHDYIHALLDIQIEKEFLKKNKTIFIPYFEGKIYHD